MAGKRKALLLVDDHAEVRNAIKQVLEAYPDVEILAEAADGEQAVALAAQHQPDVIVMDINMPKLNGIQATAQIKQAWPQITVIAISVHWSEVVWREVVQAGAVTLLPKETAGEGLYPFIKAASTNQRQRPGSKGLSRYVLLI